MASRPCSTPRDFRDDLELMLDELVARFNERDLPRAVLRDVGVVLIKNLAPSGEAERRVAQWRERWRETVRLEAVPLRKPE